MTNAQVALIEANKIFLAGKVTFPELITGHANTFLEWLNDKDKKCEDQEWRKSLKGDKQ